jgi:hypothetical protein
MRKITLLVCLCLLGCLQTTTHKVEIRGRKRGDLWWRDRDCCAIDSSTTACVGTPSLSDEEYFKDRVIRWPDGWRSSPAPEAPVVPQTEPKGELY